MSALPQATRLVYGHWSHKIKSMSEQEKIEKYQKAWEKFETKMASLRKRQQAVLARIIEKLDKQKLDKLRDKLRNQ